MNLHNYFVRVVLGWSLISARRRMARGEDWVSVVKNTVFMVGMMWGMIVGFIATWVVPAVAHYIDVDYDMVYSFVVFGAPQYAFGIYMAGLAFIYYGVFKFYIGFDYLSGVAAALSEDESACKYYKRKGFGLFVLLVFVFIISLLFVFSPGYLLEGWEPKG